MWNSNAIQVIFHFLIQIYIHKSPDNGDHNNCEYYMCFGENRHNGSFQCSAAVPLKFYTHTHTKKGNCQNKYDKKGSLCVSKYIRFLEQRQQRSIIIVSGKLARERKKEEKNDDDVMLRGRNSYGNNAF